LSCEKVKADVTCTRCQHVVRRFGTYGKRRIQRYRCKTCKITFSEPAPKLGSHYTTPDVAAKALAMMLEGMSVRAISRLTGLHKHTILALMNTASERARQLLDSRIRNISPRFVQMDEMWAYIHTREPHLNEGDPAEWGSTMLWLALDSETKLIITHHIGRRSGVNAHAFVSDLRKRTEGRYQATTDQYNAYIGAMREYFGQNVDFAQLRKIYASGTGDGWYGSGDVVGAVPHVKIGRPDFAHISTSHVERGNLSVRMHLRRFTRLTNAFSKTLANLKDAAALYVAFYNFCRVHQTLPSTPAMAARLTDHVWSVAELLTTHN
jgi:transposase-like protein/IS1 family transposase